MLNVFFVITFSGFAIGEAMSMAGDQANGDAAKVKLFALLDTVSPIDPMKPPQGWQAPDASRFMGKVSSRPVVMVCLAENVHVRVHVR